jgi:hypothetical protein
LQSRLARREAKVESWKRDETIEICMAVITGVLGLAIGIHHAKDKSKYGWVVRSMGFTVSALTLITPIIFAADFKTMRRAIEKAEPLLEQLDDLANTYRIPGQLKENRDQIQAEFLRICTDFDQLSQELAGEHANSSRGVAASFLRQALPESAVYAQGGVASLPDWTKVSQSRDSLGALFVGRSLSSNLSDSRKNSYNDAIARAAVFFAGTGPAKVVRLATIVRQLATVTNTWIVYDQATKQYQYITQIHVSDGIRDIPAPSSPDARAAHLIIESNRDLRPTDTLRSHLDLPGGLHGPVSCIEVDLQEITDANHYRRIRVENDAARLEDVKSGSLALGCHQAMFLGVPVEGVHYSESSLEFEVKLPTDLSPGTYTVEHVATYPIKDDPWMTQDFWGAFLTVAPQTFVVLPGAAISN